MFRSAFRSALLASTLLASAGATAAHAENRLALVIGESAYRAVPSLPNPANDARAMASLLTEAGFTVTTASDLSQRELNQKVGDFTAKANTTVTVEMFDETDTKFVLSQSTIPSGNVTFVINNKCIGSCSFDLEGVHAGRTLNPGESETWTVALAPGTYRYHCDVFPEGMKGTFTVTP